MLFTDEGEQDSNFDAYRLFLILILLLLVEEELEATILAL